MSQQPTPPSVSISQEEGIPIGSFVKGLILAVLFGCGAGGIAVYSLMHTPGDLAETQAAYEAAVQSHRDVAAAAVRAASSRADEAREAEARAETAARERAAIAAERDRVEAELAAVTAALEDPIEPAVIERTPVVVRQRLQDYAAALRTTRAALELERNENALMKVEIGALRDSITSWQEAHAQERIARVAAEERAELAENRVREWERTSSWKPKAALIGGGAGTLLLLLLLAGG